MENYFLKPFIVLFFLFMTIVSHSKTVEFELKSLPTQKSTAADIEKGLLTLYKNSISPEDLKKQIQLAQDFQNEIYGLIDQKIATQKNIPAEVSERILKGNFVKETVIRFPSLIQREDGHPSNQVVAKIYAPAIERPYCDYKYPTTILLHHILNELPKIEDASKLMATGLIHQPGIIVVLHMPHYGDRKKDSENFLNPDLASFRKNVMQLILDTHMLRNFLETRANIDKAQISLTGFSLGAVMGTTIGAFDQGFNGYGSINGGVDMANILFNRAKNRPESEVATAMKGIQLDETYFRNELAAADGMTWLHRYQNKRFFALNASRDDIILYENSVKPLLNSLKANNDVIERLNDDTHTPTGSLFKKLGNIFYPMMNFIVGKNPTYNEVCPLNTN